MKKIILVLGLFTTLVLANNVVLKKGWNLIGIPSTFEASFLSKYPSILSATGGGLGGGSDFSYDKSLPVEFQSGVTKEGQGYWINVSDDMTLEFLAKFLYRAWGIGGDDIYSLSKLRINGINYTVIPYSTLSIDQSNASLQGEFSLLVGNVLSKTIPQIKINSDYIDKKIKLKFYASEDTFDDTTLIKTSEEILVKSGATQYGNISFINPNDYSVPQVKDDGSELPPIGPSF